MQIQERLIVPTLGVIILLSVLMLGVPLVYKVLLGLLGLAVAGTYFAPYRVQLETRIVIAALGLIILVIVSSPALLLTLLSFGAIAALIFPHRHKLQRNPATIAWLNTLLKGVQSRRSGGGDGEDEAEDVVATGNAAGKARYSQAVATLPAFVRMNAAGISCVIVGALVLLSVFMPWFGFLVSAFGELAGGTNLTLRAASEDLSAFRVFFYILFALGVLSILSIGLPRVVSAIIAAVGLAVTFASYLYMVGLVEREASELSNIGAGVTAIPSVGSLLAGLAFLVMFVLQLIPKANRP